MFTLYYPINETLFDKLNFIEIDVENWEFQEISLFKDMDEELWKLILEAIKNIILKESKNVDIEKISFYKKDFINTNWFIK